MPRVCRPAYICVSLLVVAGCASRSTTTPVAPVAPPPAAAAPAPLPPRPAAAPAVDPIEALIAESNRHFDVGQREMQAGHLEAARLEFNRALELVMQWNTGPRSDPRLREHFDRLVERVSAVEILALAEGDGFAEPILPACQHRILSFGAHRDIGDRLGCRGHVAQQRRHTGCPDPPE